MNIKLILIPIACFFIIKPNTKSQEDILKKQVTAEFTNIRLNDAFRHIEKQLSIYFTFDGSLININKKINHSFKDLALRSCLDVMLGDSNLYYKVIENHVIIRCCKHSEIIKEDSAIIPRILIVKGKIMDKANKEPLVFATVGIKNRSIGVVSNNDGEFILKIPIEMEDEQLCVSCLGYSNICLPVSELVNTSKDFLLERSYISLQEVIIRKIDSKDLIRNVLKNIENNYSKEPVYLTGFYRESVNKSHKYMFFSEAVIQIYKSSYINNFNGDLVKVLKSRRMRDLSMEDTVIVKFKSGLQASMGLDIVKNPIDFIKEENFDKYKYVMSDIVNIDNRSAYQIDFEPRPNAEDVMYEGKIYIDIHSLAIVLCEFHINKGRISKHQGIFIAKKDRNINLKLTNISYNVSYRLIGDTYHLNYVNGLMNMRVRKKGQLFYFDFDISFEMAINEIETDNVERFKKKEVARLETIFFDEIHSYDEDFWEHYNFIKPDRPLAKAIEKEENK